MSNSLASDSAPKTRQKKALGSTASEAKEAAIRSRGGEFSIGEMGNFHPASPIARFVLKRRGLRFAPKS